MFGAAMTTEGAEKKKVKAKQLRHFVCFKYKADVSKEKIAEVEKAFVGLEKKIMIFFSRPTNAFSTSAIFSFDTSALYLKQTKCRSCFALTFFFSAPSVVMAAPNMPSTKARPNNRDMVFIFQK